MHNSSNKFHKDIPIVKEAQPDPNLYRSVDLSSSNLQTQPKKYQEYPYPPPQEHYLSYEREPNTKHREESDRIRKLEMEMSQKLTRSPGEARKKCPTNLSLSFNVAGQSIVNQ